jgi:hypothetical protein
MRLEGIQEWAGVWFQSNNKENNYLILNMDFDQYDFDKIIMEKIIPLIKEKF